MRLVECTAQREYLHGEIALLDRDAGPDRLHDLVARQGLAITAHEQRQEVAGTRTDRDRYPGAVIIQATDACAACIQPEQAEPICAGGGGHAHPAPRNLLEPAVRDGGILHSRLVRHVPR